MPYKNLPGVFEDKLDGNLTILQANDNPVVLILGSASDGDTETLFTVDKVSTAAAAFGKDGTLVRGMYEASISGALNIRLFRIGATSATLSNVGGGITIETLEKDDTAGIDYKLFYDSSTKRLIVYRSSDDTVVYDNSPAYPPAAIDLGEVAVSGTAGVGGSIGSSGTPITLAAANGVSGAVYTAGTDGLNLSRMKTYEALFDAYQLLSDQNVDVVIPMAVFLDDLNVMDMTTATISSLGLASLSSYPLIGSPTDVLGKLFVQEYQGVNYFWWWFPTNVGANVNTQFTSDAGANLFPTAGSASATVAADGTVLTGDMFHEVNFGYQLADFCFRQSNLNHEMEGVIGTLPPISFSLKDVSKWVGSLPVTTTDANSNVIITTNGTGLLGIKWMAGRVTSGGVPGLIINGIDGLFNGGFIATDSGWIDGLQLKDANEHLIDIGKHLSVVATYPILANPSKQASYVATGAPTYGGFFSGLPPSSAPTNKVLTSVRLPYRIGTAKLDLLAGQRYVTFHAKPKGIVISDAPTAARPDSDYQRLSTMRIVKAVVDAVREVAEPFLGEGNNGARLAALDGAIDRKLGQLVKEGTLVRYEHTLTSSPQQRVLGQAAVELKLVPAFELRQITVTVALAAV